jgi:hypothetical protein
MSRENVELVRQTSEVAYRRALDWIDDHATTDYEWHNPPELPGGGVHRGREQTRST